ncbi:VOC family protein [Thermopolyspora sp. NPDC052614]|uniref:VOC family protein n=1 Tax=Thermopolyspora sp. NPDC052614 TaxID=3155682 RepID=UPI00344A5B5B
MPERTRYNPGVPCWADIATPDLDAAIGFYGGLFGWEMRPVERIPGYVIAQVGGRPVAGLGRTAASERPWWSSHFAVPDVSVCVAVAEAAGARVLDGPRRVPSLGRTAVLRDPAGAAFALWQDGGFPGAGLIDEPGAFCWHELAVRDVDVVSGFYQEIFGWEGRTTLFADDSVYTEFMLGGEVVAGMVQMNDEWPPEIPAHWMVYFAVADCDASAALVEELGGVVSIPPFDGQSGRIAVADDPQGAVFSIIQLT